MAESEIIKGTVVKITYQNAANGYTVASVDCDGNSVTAVGTMPLINKGDDIEATGTYTVHPTYGMQFKVSSVQKSVPTTLAGVLRYLSSGAIKGVGPSTARKIVKKFGSETIDILKNEPERIAEIQGISRQKAVAIGEEFSKQYGIRDVMIELGGFKITPEESFKIYKKYGNDSVETIKDNPFVLCEDDIGFSFERAEDISKYFGMNNNDERRIVAGIEFILKRNLLNGHTCLPINKILPVAVSFLDCDEEKIHSVINDNLNFGKITEREIDGEKYLALCEFYNAEKFISARLASLSYMDFNNFKIDKKEIEVTEKIMNITLHDMQRKAVESILSNNILILTGGPGTGKTTTLKVVIELLKRHKLNVCLAAPTGRAAKRMKELTGYDAKTIHRLLEAEYNEDGKTVFSRNEKNQLECDVIIIDEMSMVDTLLFESLLKALRIGVKIVLVGDTDQLPSVSAGNILNDLISSDKFNCIRLNKIFRQAEESAIVTNAHNVINNKPINLSEKTKDFFFIKNKDGDSLKKLITELCCERLPKAYGFDFEKDIQVLCPSKKAETGTYTLNEVLREELNPTNKSAPELFYKGYRLHENDKVMQIKNNYDIVWKKDDGEEGSGVFNGDVGFIEKISLKSGLVLIRFEDKVAEYTVEDMAQIEPAYAITVHKSQGSEFDCVILPLYNVPSKLKYKNLLYTAMTRAKKLLIIAGDDRIFFEMAGNEKKTLRYTFLKSFLEDDI